MAETAATEVLEAAATRLGRPARQLRRGGRPEREVVQAARGADLLIVARQGAAEAGPRSLGKAARFVVDGTRPARSCWSGRGPPRRILSPPPGQRLE